jgi:NADPH:quinone reductase-like Zn-dependent oxidoreductase
MRGFAVLSYGEAPAVHDLAIPDAAGAFLVRVSYAGINPLDSKLVEPAHHDLHVPLRHGH